MYIYIYIIHYIYLSDFASEIKHTNYPVPGARARICKKLCDGPTIYHMLLSPPFRPLGTAPTRQYPRLAQLRPFGTGELSELSGLGG